MKLVVLVEIDVQPGSVDRFLPLIAANAKGSRLEPGCRQFDVCTDPSRPDQVTLYEIYDDAAAFAAHRETPHYAAFRDASRDIILRLEARQLTLVDGTAG